MKHSDQPLEYKSFIGNANNYDIPGSSHINKDESIKPKSTNQEERLSDSDSDEDMNKVNHTIFIILFCSRI